MQLVKGGCDGRCKWLGVLKMRVQFSHAGEFCLFREPLFSIFGAFFPVWVNFDQSLDLIFPFFAF
jgi:hypothetical protein